MSVAGVVPAPVEDWLDANARVRADDLALADGERSLTHREVLEAVRDVAHRIEQLVDVGQVVALSADADVEGVVALLGLFVSRAVAAPLNTRLKESELERYLDQIRPRLILTRPGHRAAGRASVPTGGIESLGSHLLLEMPTPPDPAVADGSVVAAFPTGGTTGAPKAALWTREGLALAIGSSIDNLRVTADDVELYISPLFHVTVIPGFLATLAAGGRVVLQPRFDPAAAAERIERGEVTRIFGTPTALTRVLDQLTSAPLPHPMTLIYGASRSGQPFRKRLRSALPHAHLYSGYGATEVGAVVRLKPEHGDGDRGVGCAVPGVELTIVDADQRPVPVGGRGRVAIRSPFACVGYLGHDAPTLRRLEDGSVVTEDVGWLDDQGFLHLDGRASEMIKTGGENVFPAEVESVLLAHPGVRDAAVVGVDDDLWGEQVRALVVPEHGSALDADALMAHCRQHLAGYKVPKVITLVDELPMTASMKVDRAALRGLAASC